MTSAGRAALGVMATLVLSFAAFAQDAKTASVEELKRHEKQMAVRQERIPLQQEARDADARLASYDLEHGIKSSAKDRAAYYVATVDAIRRQWTRPDKLSPTIVCPVRITQRRGGEVVDVEVLPTCAYDADARRSVEVAIRKASPLPYAGFEDVFATSMTLRFRADDTPAELQCGT